MARVEHRVILKSPPVPFVIAGKNTSPYYVQVIINQTPSRVEATVNSPYKVEKIPL